MGYQGNYPPSTPLNPTQLGTGVVTSDAIANGAVVPADLSTGGPYWDTSGNVGIGTTSPNTKLVVSNAGAAGLEIAPTGFSSAPSIVSYNRSGAAYTQLTLDASVNVFAISGTERMRIDSSGNVGVGTSSPSASLSVVKQTTALSGTGNSYGLYMYPTSSGLTYIDAITGSTGNTSLGFRTYNNGTYNEMRMDSSGNVGIGTSSPANKLDVNGSISDSIGNVRSIPQNSQTTGYTLVASDNGKHISITTGGVTVPASVFSIGQVVSVYNNSASNQTITQGATVTLRQAGTANTGNRTLAQYGLCTIICVASNTFVISGSGLS